jgi:hypothetical protein
MESDLTRRIGSRQPASTPARRSNGVWHGALALSYEELISSSFLASAA